MKTGAKQKAPEGPTTAADAPKVEAAGPAVGRLENAITAAESAFWAAIADQYPEIKTGDLDPLEAVRLSEAMGRAVRAWLDANGADSGEPVAMDAEGCELL